MASSRKKYEMATRRLHAVAFLSNISLDGTYKDTDFRHIPTKGMTSPGSGTTSKTLEDRWESNTSRMLNSYHSDGEGRFQDLDQKGYQPFRERCGTNTDSYKEKYSTMRTKKVQLLSSKGLNSDDRSSTESLDYGPYRSGTICSYAVRVVDVNKVQSMKEDRMAMATQGGVPILLFSTIPYSKNRGPRDHRRRNTSGTRPLSSIIDSGVDPFDLLGLEREEDGLDMSYSKLLAQSRFFTRDQFRKMNEGDLNQKVVNRHPHIIARTKLLTRRQDKEWCFSYETTQRNLASSPPLAIVEKKNVEWDMDTSKLYYPNVLDDPELIAGKHRTLLTFTSYMTSIIDYVRPQDLKKELNDKFKEKFPHIKLTLSKLRSIKKEMRKIAKHDNGGIDLLCVAQAYVYFEKLILANYVTKDNRKLCAGACLMLSAKLNDVKGEQLKSLLERIETTFRLNKKDLLRFEFAVLVALEFGLHIPPYEVFPHYQRLLHES